MALTNSKNVLALGKKSVDIIEFGKDLYNAKSVVLMPGKGGSTDVATTDYDSMMKLALREGFVSLAVVFKQFEFDSRRRLILTGHTDSDDGNDNAINFDLGSKRAEAVYCLLTGKKDRWAALAREKHCLRDCKWIMAYFNYLGGGGFDCNPWKIDDEWDDKNKTFDAVKGFFKGLKTKFGLGIDADALATAVKDDANHYWPEAIWKAVFDLYILQIRDILGVDANGLKDLRDKTLKFAKVGKEFIGCGSSFPMTTPRTCQYNKEKYRRVEALFFYQNEVPGRRGRPRIVCVPAGNDLHTNAQCPIYHDNHFRANYIDPMDDVNMVAYHMKFDFFNLTKIKNNKPQITQVPEGLTITAYHYTGTGASRKKEKISSITKFNKGVYTIKVYDKKRKDIYFEFRSVTKMAPKLQRRWVYTKNKNSEPELVIKNDEDIKKLMVPDKFEERLNYYDLPFEWTSENYLTRYKEVNAWKGGRFQEVIKDKLQLKPHGDKKADVNNPMIFSLDDIVLVDKDGKQDIKDKNQNDGPEELSGNSRLAIYHVVKDDLKLYKPKKSDSIQNPKVESASFSETNFRKDNVGNVRRNVITDVPGGVRGIMFANDFYGVFDKRTGQKAGTLDLSKLHIKGARAACLVDPEAHYAMKMKAGEYFDVGAKINLVNGDKTVNGTGTAFKGNVWPNYEISIWDGLNPDGSNKWKAKKLEVENVISETRLTLKNAPVNADGVVGNNLYFMATPPHHRYFCEVVGHYELHFIHFGCPYKGQGGYKVRSFLIVYWNGRFEKNQKALDVAKPSIKNHIVSDTDIENFERIGLKNAKERWEQKNYLLEPLSTDADGKGKIQVKLVWFFEAKRTDRGGKHKCVVKISNDEGDGDMGVSESHMYYLDYKIRNYLSLAQYGGAAQFRDIDGQGPPYEGLTVSHELGHGTGLFDDYAYHGGEHVTTDDSYFGQWYLGMPYHHDLGSMMQTNRAPRMKQMYHYMNRFNDAAIDDKELKGLLKESQYQVAMRYKKGGAWKRLIYSLKKNPNDYRDIYKPFKFKRKHATGTGEVDLFLYKIGPDEMARTIKIGVNPPGFAFDGINVVFIKIGFIFHDVIDHSDPTNLIDNIWSDWDKWTWMENVRNKIKSLNYRFYLKGTNADFKNTYIFFFPICLEYKAINKKAHDAKDPGTPVEKIAAGNAAEAATKAAAHYTIEVTFNKTRKVPARAAPLSTLKVGNRVDATWIAKYILGHDRGGNTWNNPVGAQSVFTSANFQYVRTWIRSADGLNDNSFDFRGA